MFCAGGEEVYESPPRGNGREGFAAESVAESIALEKDHREAGDSRLSSGNGNAQRRRKQSKRAPSEPTELRVQMRVDKQRYQRERRQTNKAAARRIAENRFDAIRQDDYVSTARGAVNGGESDTRPYYWRSEQKQQLQGASRRPLSEDNDLASDAYLHSGRGALEIADAFLKGTVYTRLLRGSGDYESVKERVVNADEAEHDEHDERVVDIAARRNEYEYARRPTAAPDIANKPQPEPLSQRSAKGSSSPPPYLNGWRNTKGGWVADFGPLHTHTLSFSSAPNDRRAARLRRGDTARPRDSNLHDIPSEAAETVSSAGGTAVATSVEAPGGARVFQESSENNNMLFSVRDPSMSLLTHVRQT